MGALSPFYSVAPDCIHHGLPGGLAASAEIQKPFENCTGYFTFGRGTVYGGAPGQPAGDHLGQVIQGASVGLWTITVIGIIVMILALVAWVWTEHRTLMSRAEKLKAAGEPYGIQGPPRMG